MNKILVLVASFIVISISLISIFLNFNLNSFLIILSVIIPFIIIWTYLMVVWILMGGPGSFRVTKAFLKRNIHVFISYKFQILMSVVNIFIIILIYYVVGKPFLEKMISSMTGALLDYGEGYDFISFFIVGFITWPMLWSGYRVSSETIRQEQVTGMFEIMIQTKTGVKVLPFAYLLRGAFGSVLQTSILLVVLMFLLNIDLKLNDPVVLWGFMSILLLSLLTMWGLGLIFGGLTIMYKKLGPLGHLLQTSMLFFCGVYIPIEILPNYIQPLSYALPLTYAFRAIRSGMIAGNGIIGYWRDALGLCVFCIFMLLGGYYILALCLKRARKSGSIYGY